MSPEQAADHLEIEQVLQRYFRAMDTWDYALLDRVFTPDAVLRYEVFGSRESSYRDMIPAFRDFNRHFSFMQHSGSQLLIDLEGDSARASASLRAVHVQTTHEGEENEWVIHGVYRDRLRRTPAGWRIAQRHFRQTRTQGELLPFERVRRFERPPWL